MNQLRDNHVLVHIVSYLFWGVATTVVNIAVYYGLRTGIGFTVALATGLAWFFSVLFAFVTNRAFVFQAKKGSFFRQLMLFYGSRLFSGVVDVLLMAFLVTALQLPELISKLGVNVVVVILNYVLSLLFVFNAKEAKK